LKVERAIGVRRDQRRRRQRTVRRVGDDPECRERNPMLGRNARGHMGLHIDRHRTGFFMKLAFGVGAGERHIGTRNVAERNVAKGSAPWGRTMDHVHQRLRPAVIARVTAVVGDDVARDDARAWLEMRCEPPRDAEAQDTVAALPNCDLK